MTANVNDIQIGGNHYQKGGDLQHWDWVEDNGLRYLEGCATKYVARNRTKHESPVEDLEKAKHYVEKMIEKHSLGNYPPHIVLTDVTEFAQRNDLTEVEARIIEGIANWHNHYDLIDVILTIQELIDNATELF